MIKGVPIELQTVYNQQPENYLLLGLMADAADEAGELEVGEALRWLWSIQWKPLKVTLTWSEFWGPFTFRTRFSEEVKAVQAIPLPEGFKATGSACELVASWVYRYTKWKESQ